MPYTIEKKVQPILIRLYCDCGREMNFEKKTFLCYPPKYVYNCSCGKSHEDVIDYPKLEYKEVEEYERLRCL